MGNKGIAVVCFLFFLINFKVSGQLMLPTDTLEMERLYIDAFTANEEGDFEVVVTKIDSLIEFCLQKDDWYLAYFLGLALKTNFASDNNRLDVYYKSIKELEQKSIIYEKELGEDRKGEVLDTEIRLGTYYSRRGSFNRAQEIFENVLHKLNTNTEFTYKNRPTLLMHISSVHKKIGNYESALNYINECKTAFIKGDQEYFEPGYQGLINKHIADIHNFKKEKKLAESYYNYAIKLTADLPITGRNVSHRIINSYNALSKFYVEEGKPKKAVSLLNTSLSFHTKTDPKLEETYRILAQAYVEAKNYELANQYFQKSIESNKFDLKNYQIAKTYTAIANMYISQNQLLPALDYFQKALINLQDDFNLSDYCENPTNFNEVLAKKDLIQVLHHKARTLFELSKNDTQQLICAWKTIQIAVNLVDNIKIDNTADYDKQFLVEESYPLFEDAIAISLAQPNNKGVAYALKVAEKSKSTLLLAAIRNTQIRNFFVPDSLIDLEQQYKFELQTLEELKYEEERKGNEIKHLAKEISALQKSINTLITFFKNNYPKYFDLRYNTEIIEVEDIKERLTPDKVFLEYFIGKEKSYVFLVQKNEVPYVFTIDITTSDLNKIVQDFLYAIYIPHIKANDGLTKRLKTIYTKEYADQKYADNAFKLHELLLKPILFNLPKGCKKLEIIPDGVLNYLPFDALIQQEVAPEMIGYYENELDYQYVGRDFQISYCYSATLMDLMSNGDKIEQQDKNGLLVFHDKDFTAQTTSIQNIFQRYSFLKSFVNVLHEKANKENLKQESEKYKYLHFSVHGVINNERPAQSYLKLRSTSNGDSLLYLRDIYSMTFPTDMIFTSACNAGIGPLSKGEGLLSLARGFAYSGAKSLITTLWTVKGGASNQLLTEFYKNIRDGATKDEALFLAKKVNLKTAAYAHPYYWAGFIPIGNMEAIEMPLSIWNLVGGASLFLIGLLIFIRFKKIN